MSKELFDCYYYVNKDFQLLRQKVEKLENQNLDFYELWKIAESWDDNLHEIGKKCKKVIFFEMYFTFEPLSEYFYNLGKINRYLACLNNEIKIKRSIFAGKLTTNPKYNTFQLFLQIAQNEGFYKKNASSDNYLKSIIFLKENCSIIEKKKKELGSPIMNVITQKKLLCFFNSDLKTEKYQSLFATAICLNLLNSNDPLRESILIDLKKRIDKTPYKFEKFFNMQVIQESDEIFSNTCPLICDLQSREMKFQELFESLENDGILMNVFETLLKLVPSKYLSLWQEMHKKPCKIAFQMFFYFFLHQNLLIVKPFHELVFQAEKYFSQNQLSKAKFIYKMLSRIESDWNFGFCLNRLSEIYRLKSKNEKANYYLNFMEEVKRVA